MGVKYLLYFLKNFIILNMKKNIFIDRIGQNKSGRKIRLKCPNLFYDKQNIAYHVIEGMYIDD